MKLSKEFRDHVKGQYRNLEALKLSVDAVRRTRMTEMSENKRRRTESTLRKIIDFAQDLGVCTREEVARSCAAGFEIHTRSLDDKIGTAVSLNTHGVIDFLWGRTNKAIRIANMAGRYNPPQFDPIPDGFLGWKRFVIA
jgi:hypothetical protein